MKDDTEAGGGAELLDAVQSQENELAHQMAALQHYNKQKEMYRQQHGWNCPACSFLNDPHSSKCEICDSARPGGEQITPPASSQPILPQPQQRQQQVQPAAPQPKRAPSLPASSPSLPTAMPVAKPGSQSSNQRASLPASQASNITQSRPTIPASLPSQSSSSASPFLQQPSLPTSKPAPSSSSTPTSPLMPGLSRELTPSQQQLPSSKASLGLSSPSVQPPLSSSPSLPSAAPVQRAVSSGPLSPPAVVPVPLHGDWGCDICTYRNSWGDDKCLMCMAPKPLTIAPDREPPSGAAKQPAYIPPNSPIPPSSPNPQPAAIPPGGPMLSSSASTTSAASNAPSIPATVPSIPLNARRATQPLPSSRPSTSSAASPPAGRLSVLEGVPGGMERGPAPVPGGDAVRFPAQFQQQQMQQAMYQQGMARQQAMRQQMALQAQQHAQQVAAMSAAQQLASLTPLSQQQSPPSQQRQQLQQAEEWLRRQHEEKQQQLHREQQQRAAEQRNKGSLDLLINEHFEPSRRADKPVELPPAAPTPPLSGRTSPAPSLLYPLAVASPPTNARSLSNSSSAPPGAPPSQFHSMFDQAAHGFAHDLVGRRASHDHISVQTAPPRAATPTSQLVPASPSPSPIPGASVSASASADFNSDSPKSARSDSAASNNTNKPRRDRSPVKREARASLPLDQLKMPFSVANVPVTSPIPLPVPAAAAPSQPSPPRAAATQPQTQLPQSAPAFPSSTPPVASHQRLDSWDIKAAAAAAEGRQITPFDTPQSTPQATQSSNALFDFTVSQPAVSVAAAAGSGEKEGQRAGEAAIKFAPLHEQQQQLQQAVGEGSQRGRARGEGEAEDNEAAWQRRPGYVHEEAQVQQEKKSSLSPKKRPAERASLLTAPSPVPAPTVVAAPKRPISDEAKGSISALAAALAASAAQQASVKATQSPAAEARDIAAAAALPPHLPVPELSALLPAPIRAPAQPVKPSAPIVPPHPAKTLALQLPRSDSGSITRPGEEPSTPVSTNRSSSTTRARSPSSKEYIADMREKVRAEILSTEQFYVDALNDLIKYYMQPLQRLGPKMHVEPRHVSAMFQNLTVLQQFHSIFLDDLRRNPNTAAVFVQFADFLKMYTQYVAGYEKSIATINSLRQNKAFQKLMEVSHTTHSLT